MLITILAFQYCLSFVLTRTIVPGKFKHVISTQGLVRGYWVDSPPHFAYMGIPYARPPTGELRFKPPEPPRPWDAIFEATHRVKCTQPSGKGDENCLVLNVFAPRDASMAPVMIHFHDGGFQEGWGAYNPPIHLLEREIVIVTFNYRVGALGFLSLGTKEIPGNAGLKDQVAMLYWIQRNIENFGGNPDDITVYGTGAGAASIEFLLISGLTTNMFHKAILESGSILSPLSLTADPLKNARDTANALGFSGNMAKMESSFKKTHRNRFNSSWFLPSVETDSRSNSLIDVLPLQVLNAHMSQKVPILYVYTNLEGLLYVDEYEDTNDVSSDFFVEYLPVSYSLKNETTRIRLLNLIKDLYISEDSDMIKAQMDFFGDIYVRYPMYKSAFHQSQSMPVYFMEFSFDSANSAYESEFRGARHGDIMNIIFSNATSNFAQEMMASRLSMLWENFIKLGDPTPLTTTLIPLIWQPLHPEGHNEEFGSGKCLHLGHNAAMQYPSYSQRLCFWDKVYQLLSDQSY